MSQSTSPSARVIQPANEALAKQQEHALIIVSSASLQTQGMAMVLSRALQEQGVQLNILLCDKAGDLAIDGYKSAKTLAPKDMKPENILQKILEDGAQVAVCALYLPNSAYQEQDLRKGIEVAQPAQVAQMMRYKDSKVFTF